MGENRERALRLLRGAYELHVHTSPSHFPRLMDDYEYIQELDCYGMAGAVVKCHLGETASRVALLNEHAGFSAKLYGSITLSTASGGINAAAVRAALLFGAKVVWMPALHSQRSVEFQRSRSKEYPVSPGEGIRVLDDEGKLVPEVFEVMDVVREFDAVLSTGHLAQDECLALCKESTARGVKTCITHPDSHREAKTLDQELELADMGCVIAKNYGDVTLGAIAPEAWIESIKTIGPERIVMTTDYGQKTNCSPCEAMLDAIELVLDGGIASEDIETMVKANPMRLLGVA